MSGPAFIRSGNRLRWPVGLLFALLLGTPSARAEMELVFREMFATTGRIDAVNTGAVFTRVEGVFHHRPGGPRIAGLPPASADLRNVDPAPFAIVDLPDDGETRLFLCGWFHFKSFQEHGARLLAITDQAENPGPSIFVENSTLKAGSEYSALEKVPFPVGAANRWVFLGVAVVLHAERQASMRYYYKFPGHAMQVWAEYNQVSIGLPRLGGFEFGARTSNSGVRCRLGAPSAYRFENSDFSDIVYPPDLLEPESGLTWYCNPATGDDANDGTSPDRAWATIARINEESRYTGILPSDMWETGDTLIIDTRLAPLETNGKTLSIATAGLNVRAAPGNEWIRVKSYRTLDPGAWEPSGIPNVYATADTEEHIVIWEDDKFLHHPTGPDLAAVQPFLSATPGSFWTDGVRLYLHPFGSTDPRSDGKRYERSRVLNEGAAVMLKAPNLSIEDLHVGKTCLSRSYDGDSIGAYCVGNDGPMGRTRIAHCYLYYGSKHNIGLTTGGPGDDVLVEDVQCEQGSPYGGPGGQTVFVSFNHQPLPLGIIHRYHRCKTIANAGLIGSAEGTMSPLFPVFYAHNLGTPGEPDQFALFEFIDCDFGNGPVFGSGVEQVRFEGSRFGDLSFGADVEIERCRIDGPVSGPPGYDLTIRNSLLKRSGMLTATPVAGRLVVEGCHLDGSGITSIQGGVPQAALFTRSAPLDVVFRNNVVILPKAAVGANVFSWVEHTDGLLFERNAYKLGGNKLVHGYNTGSGAATMTFPQWQALGRDAGSFEAPGPLPADTAPGPGSPLLDAGVELTPAEDFTGVPLLRRNDIGAYEGPPTRFDEWQFLHFSEAERDVAGTGGAGGSLFGDGVPNLMKYALGLPARMPAAADPFGFAMPSAAQRVLQFRRNRLAGDLDWSIERSADLRVWEKVVDPVFQVLETDGATESLRVTIPPATGKTFFRVRVGIR